MNVVTRIAPSPTGYLHFGLARTALFSYLYAKKHGGTFIVRIEDTDVARNKPEYESDIDEQLAWLGLNADKRFRQSEHRARHTECLRMLIDKDLAYESTEPAKDDPTKMVTVIRLRNKGEEIAFTDEIRGEIRFDTTELGDFVIARAIDDPLYHLAVVIDDNDEGVTHIIRGDDHISNTPRHILLQRALGFPTPRYAHIPLILMADRSKMSKRKHESAVKAYREKGILPEAMINYLALLGWNPGGEREIFSLSELVDIFEIEKVHKSGAVFNEEKLLWFNHEYLRALSDNDFLQKLSEFSSNPVDPRLAPLLKERARTLKEAAELIGSEFGFLSHAAPTAELLLKGAKADAGTAKRHLAHVHELLESASDFSNGSVKEIVFPYADEKGRASVLWPLRVALTGMEKSPDPFISASLLGKEETLTRISAA
ncbi:MAG TPA: glutamate--tRNA ligase family protein, partial [Candidatus Paceibacterota bacterium]|nr:glutamate--tRNA ligase family protein [Candidatus Paceibacterota bacterium]